MSIFKYPASLQPNGDSTVYIFSGGCSASVPYVVSNGIDFHARSCTPEEVDVLVATLQRLRGVS